MGAEVDPALKKLGFSKLMSTAWKGDLVAVQRILTPRTKTLLGNAKDKMGNTALIWAMRRKHYDVVKYLVQAGVNLNAKNKRGSRALPSAENDEIRLFWNKLRA